MTAVRDILIEALQTAVPDAAAEEAELLKSIKNEELKRNVFICLIYRMDLRMLREMLANNASSDDVIQERNAYLVNLASNQDPVIRDAQSALEKVEMLQKEQDDIKEYLKNEMAQALEMAKASGEREREALREQVAILKEQLGNEQQQKAELKEKAEQMSNKLKEDLSRIEEYEARIKELQQKSSSVTANMSVANVRTEEQLQQLQEFYELYRKRRRFRRSETAALQELEDFCAQLAGNPDLNYEQKDCLLSCLEQGYPLSLISKVMIATLTPEEMLRFIKVYEKRMGGRKI